MFLHSEETTLHFEEAALHPEEAIEKYRNHVVVDDGMAYNDRG